MQECPNLNHAPGVTACVSPGLLAGHDKIDRMTPRIYTDTSLEVERMQIELMRAAPAWRKVELAGQMFDSMKLLARAGLRQRYPQADETELQRRLADLLLGPALGERVFGPLEQSDGS